MHHREIVITAFDQKRLQELIAETELRGATRQDLAGLAAELKRAHILDPKEVPANVVTMNSQVLLRDLDTDETLEYHLVFPENADITTGRLSVLAPVGTAILGYRAGDVVEWQVPSGIRRLRIEKILYQPEAAGHYHL